MVGSSVVSDSLPMDCSLPGSSVHGIFQATHQYSRPVLEWVAISFSNVVGTQQIILLTVISTEFRCRIRGNSHQSQYFKQIEVFISCITRFLEIVCLILS